MEKEDIVAVLKALVDVYTERGRDYTFKARHIAENLKKDSNYVSKKMYLYEKKGLVAVKRTKSHRGATYRTMFSGNENIIERMGVNF